MDTFNANLYSNIRNRISGNSDSLAKWQHDEDVETKMIDDLSNYRKAAKELYMRSLLNPERHLAKIPSRMPVESAIASLNHNFTITPNATGKFLLVVDPFYNSGYLYQDSLVNGTGGGTLTSITFPQDNTIIDQWRLVSSSLILKYYGNFNQMSGLFVAATTSNTSAAAASTYLTFQNVENLTNKQVLKCIDGCKLIYSPMDEKATEFWNGSSFSAGNHPCRWQYLFVICGDLFPNAGTIRVDYFRNIEYTATPSYREYITQTKDLPCDFSLPSFNQTVSSAPKDFNGNFNTPSSDWSGEVRDFAKTMLKDVVGNTMKAYNPFVDKQFKGMDNIGIFNSLKNII